MPNIYRAIYFYLPARLCPSEKVGSSINSYCIRSVSFDLCCDFYFPSCDFAGLGWNGAVRNKIFDLGVDMSLMTFYQKLNC